MAGHRLTKLSRILSGDVVWPPPVWLMRQAGRYLPEYRELRQRAGSFWTMCMTPELAAEITLQPMRRFGFDAAIIFSDILVIPYALGRKITFEESVGPRLDPVRSVDELDLDRGAWADKLAPSYEALRIVHDSLDADTALLGFAGAPWTLATYMAEGGGSPDQRVAKLWGYREPEQFARLLGVLEDCVAAHLVAQLQAGADAVQIFDSWASGLPAAQFHEWIIAPTRRIVDNVRRHFPKARIIGFPRAATLDGYERYAAETGVDAINVDTAVSPDWAADSLAPRVAVQGNLDPLALVAGGSALDKGAEEILSAMQGKRFIFNLGHGVVPETPVDHVTQLVRRIREGH